MHQDPRPEDVAAEASQIEADAATMEAVRKLVEENAAKSPPTPLGEVLRAINKRFGDGSSLRAFALAEVARRLIGRESSEAAIGEALGKRVMDGLLDVRPQYGNDPPPEVFKSLLDEAVGEIAETYGCSPEYVREVWNREADR
jgi:hypothetical protein